MGLPDLIPIELLFGNPEVAMPRMSPDGQRIAYLGPVAGVLNIHVGTTATGAADSLPVTEDRSRGVRQYGWAPDSRHLLYLQDLDGDENWRLFTVDLETSEVVDRTPYDGVQARLVAVSPRVRDRVIVGLNRDDPRYHDLYLLDLATGELTREESNPGFEDWIVDHELRARGGVRTRPDGSLEYVLRDGDGDGWQAAITTPATETVMMFTTPVGFHGDDRRIWISDTRSVAGTTARLSLWDPETGEVTVRAQHPERDLVSALLHPTTFEPQLAGYATDRFEYEVLDPSLGDDLSRAATLSEGDLHIASRSDDDRKWIAAYVVDRGPTRFYLFDRDTKKGTFLFEDLPALSDVVLAPVEPFSFTAGDNLDIHGFITFPVGLERRNLPAVVNVHGGPWGARHEWGYQPTNQWLANRGYACIEVNYRGSGGYGTEFVNASTKEWAGRMHSDLTEAVDWAVAQGWVDPDRVAIFGGSYGGYSALVGATFTPDFFRCAVDIVGPVNLITLLETIPPYWYGASAQMHRMMGDPAVEADRAWLWERSPLSRVDQIRIPMLIAQGANDPRVKQSESEQIVAAMAAHGIDYEYMLFPDEGHGFAKPENRTKFYLAAESFLATHLGGRAST